MFPDMDSEVIEAVLRANNGAVDATIVSFSGDIFIYPEGHLSLEANCSLRDA